LPRLSIAREISYDTLVGVIRDRKNPDDLLDMHYQRLGPKLKRIDKNLAKEIVYGTLRWWSKMYWILQHTSSRDLNKSSDEVKVALCAGTYQIYYLSKIPDRAAVNESAEYMRKRKQVSAVSFVNGILRQIAKKASYFPKPDKEKKPVEYLSLQYAHPEWMVKRWFSRFKFDRLSDMLKNSNETPPITIRMNSLKTDLEAQADFMTSLLREESTHAAKRPLRGAIRLKSSPDLGAESLFGQGFYTIQDESSQLIAHLVAPKQGDVIVDSCSGPGGKLTHVYELGKGEAKIYSIEKDTLQYEKAISNAERLGFDGIEFVHTDFLEYTPPQTPNKVLIDAPCTGLGVLRRHPDGKYHKKPDIIGIMASKQRAILTHALSMLEVGGEIVFSVCSFESEETSDQLKWLLKEFDGKIEVVDPADRVQDFYKKYITKENVLSVYAGNKDLMDGFGAFIIKKTTDI
jgi:16S rRNA (cytosine967-C5)-methyltransferase